jgi:hypothetical protein
MVLLSDFGKHHAIFIIEFNWPSIVSVLLTGVQSTWVPNNFTAHPRDGSDQHSEANKHTKHKQLSHRTEKELLAAPQQLVKMSSARASSSHPTSTRLAQRTPQFFHSTTNPLEHHPAKPWSNLKLKTIPGGEGQAISSSPRRWRTRSHSGGEGQAIRS